MGTPVDPGHAGAVVAPSGDCARHVRAVGIAIHRVAVAVGEVVAVDVVDVAVAIVVDSVAGDFTRVGPDVLHQVRMRVVDAGIDNADDNIAAGLDVPGLGGVDIRIGSAARLARVAEAPELAEVGVVGNRGSDRERIIRLDVFDPRILAPDG